MTLMTLARRAAPAEAAGLLATAFAEDGGWVAAHAVNNRMPPASELFSAAAQHARRARLDAQRLRMGRIEAALLVYAYAVESAGAARAPAARGYARTFGAMANFLGDDNGMDIMSDARHQQFRDNLARVAAQAADLRAQPFPSRDLEQALDKLRSEYFWAA